MTMYTVPEGTNHVSTDMTTGGGEMPLLSSARIDHINTTTNKFV
jgi:hypothetical protein